MADTSPSSAPPPGWYAESARAQRLRWWDGADWTNHYQLVVSARALQPPPPDEASSTLLDQDIEDDAELLAAPMSAAQPGPQPATEPPPLTRAERTARQKAASVATQLNPIVDASAVATMTDAAPPAPAPVPATPVPAAMITEPADEHEAPRARVFPEGAAPPAEPAPASAPRPREDRRPDPILTPDRPVRPLVYAPHASRYSGEQAAVLVEPTGGNGLSSTALALLLAAMVSAVVAYFITSWIELTSSTAWGTPTDPITTVTGLCTTAALQGALSTAGTRVVIDMTGCPTGGGIRVAPGSVNLARDAVIYVPSNAVMDLELTGVINAAAGVTDPQLFIVHADSNGSDARPTCSTPGDKFAANPNVHVRTMIYSACGINKTMSLTMTGQLYMGNDGLHLNGGTFTCEPMSWEPVLPGLSCGVKGEGGIFDPTNTVTRLDNLDFQTEQ